MIVLFTDFGWDGPYVGQMKTVLAERAPAAPVIDLMHDAPRFSPRRAAYLLAALVPRLPAKAILVGVVDPGVGSDRPAVIVEADDRWFVGPGNGLFDMVRRRAEHQRTWPLAIPDHGVAPTFHGRDVFAPTAAALGRGDPPAGEPIDAPLGNWPDDLDEVIAIDGFGNAITGRRAAAVPAEVRLRGKPLPRHAFFAQAEPGTLFWYENSSGLVEIAMAEASAAARHGIEPGTPIEVI